MVGTVVLLALALIFLPFILDGDGEYQPTISSRIPDVPSVELMPEPMPRRPVIQSDSYPARTPQPDYQLSDEPSEQLTAAQESVVDAVEPIIEPPSAEPEPATDEVIEPEPGLDERLLPAGWSVRLGIFANPRNAANLEQRLLNAGYRAYHREMSGPQGVVTGIFVGPRVERAEANDLKVQLQEEFKLAGLVVRFDVESF